MMTFINSNSVVRARTINGPTSSSNLTRSRLKQRQQRPLGGPGLFIIISVTVVCGLAAVVSGQLYGVLLFTDDVADDDDDGSMLNMYR